jgi:DNA repair exonuclease SbcCD ATPase subunit
MAAMQHFRTALGGFNREDVVRYIEYLNNQHNSQIEQLNTQLQTAQEALAKATASNADALQEKLTAAEARCAELEALLADNGQTPVLSGDELEAYRRAERAERLARDRAAQIYTQANAALADATVKVEAISDSMNTLAEQYNAQLEQSKKSLQEAVAAMYAIRPEEE